MCKVYDSYCLILKFYYAVNVFVTSAYNINPKYYKDRIKNAMPNIFLSIPSEMNENLKSRWPNISVEKLPMYNENAKMNEGCQLHTQISFFQFVV